MTIKAVNAWRLVMRMVLVNCAGIVLGEVRPIGGATFDQPLVDPMTNDFALTGFDGAASLAAPASVYQFDTLPESNVMWPTNGVQPTLANAVLGLGVNGVVGIYVSDFLFDRPVRRPEDGFVFIGFGIGQIELTTCPRRGTLTSQY